MAISWSIHWTIVIFIITQVSNSCHGEGASTLSNVTSQHTISKSDVTSQNTITTDTITDVQSMLNNASIQSTSQTTTPIAKTTTTADMLITSPSSIQSTSATLFTTQPTMSTTTLAAAQSTTQSIKPSIATVASKTSTVADPSATQPTSEQPSGEITLNQTSYYANISTTSADTYSRTVELIENTVDGKTTSPTRAITAPITAPITTTVASTIAATLSTVTTTTTETITPSTATITPTADTMNPTKQSVTHELSTTTTGLLQTITNELSTTTTGLPQTVISSGSTQLEPEASVSSVLQETQSSFKVTVNFESTTSKSSKTVTDIERSANSTAQTNDSSFSPTKPLSSSSVSAGNESVYGSTTLTTLIDVKCSPLVCLKFCAHGLKMDSNGCYTCTCAEKPPESMLTALQKLWYVFVIAFGVLIIIIVIICIYCYRLRKRLDQQERERVARLCPTDTLLKANSAFHLALTREDDLDDMEEPNRQSKKMDYIAGAPMDRETVFDADFRLDQMKSFFKKDNGKEKDIESGGKDKVLPDVCGSIQKEVKDDDQDGDIGDDSTLRIRKTSEQSSSNSNEIDYHNTPPGTPTKLTEL